MTTSEGPAATNRSPVSRRGALLAGGALAAGVAVTSGALAGCTPEPDRPDPLQPLLSAARADAATAKAAAARYPSYAAAKVIAEVRAEHAEVLQREVRRASTATTTPKPVSTAPGDVSGGQSAVQQSLRTSLRNAQRAATTLVPGLPRYRAGLVGSVAAGCASLLEGLS